MQDQVKGIFAQMFNPEMFKHLNYSMTGQLQKNPCFENNRLYKSNKPCLQKSTKLLIFNAKDCLHSLTLPCLRE